MNEESAKFMVTDRLGDVYTKFSALPGPTGYSGRFSIKTILTRTT